MENCYNNSRQTGICKVSAGIVDAQLGGGMEVDFDESLGNWMLNFWILDHKSNFCETTTHVLQPDVSERGLRGAFWKILKFHSNCFFK